MADHLTTPPRRLAKAPARMSSPTMAMRHSRSVRTVPLRLASRA